MARMFLDYQGQTRKCVLGTLAALCAAPFLQASLAQAAGYQIISQSTSVLGSAQAGMTAFSHIAWSNQDVKGLGRQ